MSTNLMKQKSEYRKQYLNTYQKQWIANRRKEWFDTNGPCRGCGSSDNLELHHVNPELKKSHNIWSWSEARRNEELAKCIPLCYECHLKETSRQRLIVGHGSNTVYNRYKCRCSMCKEAHRIYNLKYRQKV